MIAIPSLSKLNHVHVLLQKHTLNLYKCWLIFLLTVLRLRFLQVDELKYVPVQ